MSDPSAAGCCTLCTTQFLEQRHKDAGVSRTLPEQSGQVSCAGVAWPVWLHREQGCWICCIMPGPSGRIMTCTPLPWHACTSSAFPLTPAQIIAAYEAAQGLELGCPTEQHPGRAWEVLQDLTLNGCPNDQHHEEPCRA